MASDFKRVQGYCPVYLGFLESLKWNGCIRDDADRNDFLIARAILIVVASLQ
jgi:hypothetical protein